MGNITTRGETCEIFIYIINLLIFFSKKTTPFSIVFHLFLYVLIFSTEIDLSYSIFVCPYRCFHTIYSYHFKNKELMFSFYLKIQ